MIPDGTPRIVALTPAGLQDRITRNAQYFRGTDGESKRVRIPKHVTGSVLARTDWPGIRPLAGLIESPSLRPDGTLITEPGYDEQTGLFLAPTIDITIAAKPTRDDARAALAVLVDVFCDFPFESAAHLFALIAFVLTLVCRSAIDGLTPFFLVDGAVAGAGKGKASDTAGLIAYGREMPKRPYSISREEQQKVITTILLAGSRVVQLDNIDAGSTIGGPALEAAITARIWEDRALGGNKNIRVPNRTVFSATGNNLAVSKDLERRTLVIRLTPTVERPHERKGFKYPDILAHAANHRVELLGACLTIARAFIAAGMPEPEPGLTPWGSFEAWSRLIRGAIVWAGGTDPYEGRSTLVASTESSSGELLGLLQGMQQIDPSGNGLSADKVLADLRTKRHLEALANLADGKSLTRLTAGQQLGKRKGEVVQGLRLGSRKLSGSTLWFAEAVS